VEEQYYIVFPLIVLALRRFGPRAILGTIAALALASLAASAALDQVDPIGDFFLLPTRLWELLLGVLATEARLPLLSWRLGREILAGLGLILALAPIVLLGYGATLPASLCCRHASARPCCWWRACMAPRPHLARWRCRRSP
jgi:peptidoglycan/LPS O-acetylase OafA/YrhL